MKNTLKSLLAVILAIAMVVPCITVFAETTIPYKKTGTVYTISGKNYYQAETTNEYNGVAKGSKFWLDRNNNIVTDKDIIFKLELVYFVNFAHKTSPQLFELINASNDSISEYAELYFKAINNTTVFKKLAQWFGTIIGKGTAFLAGAPLAIADIGMEIISDACSPDTVKTMALTDLLRFYSSNAAKYAKISNDAISSKNYTEYDVIYNIYVGNFSAQASMAAFEYLAGEDVKQYEKETELLAFFSESVLGFADSIIPDIPAAEITNYIADGVVSLVEFGTKTGSEKVFEEEKLLLWKNRLANYINTDKLVLNSEKLTSPLSNNSTKYPTGTYKPSHSEGLNMRSGASTSNSIVGAIAYGTSFVVSQVNGNWGKTTCNGKTGWVCLDYATKTNSTTSPSNSNNTTINRDDGIWLFPVAQEYYQKFSDWCCCPGYDKCVLCGTTHSSWGDSVHGGQKGHNGIDLATPSGTPVYASASGQYFTGGSNSHERGYYVVIEHNIGNNQSYYSGYQHLSKFNSSLKSGDYVNAGDLIGYTGSSGKNSGVHLHFGIVIGESGKGIDGLEKYELWNSTNPWATQAEQTQGRIINNPADNLPTKTSDCSLDALKSHKGSIHYTFDKSNVSIATNYNDLEDPEETEQPSSSTTLVSTVSKSTFTTDENIVINWNSYSDASYYGLTISQKAGSSWSQRKTVYDKDYITGNKIDIGRLSEGSYRFQMGAYDKNYKLLGSYSDLTYFTVEKKQEEVKQAGAVEIVTPNNKTFLTTEEVVIHWKDASNATNYGLTVVNDTTEKIIIDGDFTGTSKSIGKLPSGKYRYQMRAYNSIGESGPLTSKLYFNVVAPEYKINYNANSGTGAPGTQTKTHAEDIKLSTQEPTRKDYIFLGWSTSPEGSVEYGAGSNFTLNENVTLYAIWQKEENEVYYIIYNANGGQNAPSMQTKNEDEDAIISNIVPAREGYTFDGWAIGDSDTIAYSSGDVYKENKTLYLHAVWTANTYNISYNANGGANGPKAQIKTHDKRLVLSETIPVKEGFTFVNWYDGVDVYNPGSIFEKNADTVLSAVWEKSEEEEFPFVDVPEDAWYKDDVKNAYEKGIVNGKGENRYAPEDNMTYAEAIKIACTIYQLYNDGEVSLKNGKEAWYSTFMEYAIENGIIRSDYSAVADKKITRKDFVNIFYGALPVKQFTKINNVGDNSIPDVKIGDAYSGEIYTFYRAGILTGSDSMGSFMPDSNIKRNEVCAIVTRMLDSGARKNITLN